MVLNKSVKRKTNADNSLNRSKAASGPTSKKKKSSEDENKYESQSVFGQLCFKAGMKLKNGGKYNELGVDQAVFQRDLLTAFKKHGNYPEVCEEFVKGFEEYIDETARFHKSLLPCMTSPDCESARGGCQASVCKILLGVDLIQTQLMNCLLEKLPEFTENEDISILEQGQKVDLPRLLMSQFQLLDKIVNCKEVTQKMVEMISITNVEVQREIITCLPEVVEDSEHGTVALALRDLLKENSQLTVPVLDAMSNLILKQDLLMEVRASVLQSLVSVDTEDLPVVVKFLLQSVNNQDSLEVISELRGNLELDSFTAAKPTNKKATKQHVSGETTRDTELLILDSIKSAVHFQKTVGDAFFKAIDAVKQPGNHKVIDWFLLLILHGTTRQKLVESLIRNKISAGCFTEAYLTKVYKSHAQVLKDYFPSVLNIAEVLLRSPKLQVSYFACALYRLSFTWFDAYHQQEIVGNLVSHIGSGFELEVDSSLDILSDLVNTQLTKMAPFAILVKGALDYLDNLSVCQIRKLYFMLSTLAFRDPQEGGLIQDDLHIVIRKQLSNTSPKYKRMGVIGAVMIVKSLAHSSVAPSTGAGDAAQMSDDVFKQIVGLLQQIKSSSSKSPPAYSLFMDELSTVIARGQLHAKVEEWVNENVTPDFQEDFVVDINEEAPASCSEVPMELLFGLDDLAEGSIAVNLLPLVIQRCFKRQTLATSTESPTSDPLCMSPCVRLLQVCEERQYGTLENIDALLGCPLYTMKKEVYEKLEPLSRREKEIICTTLFFAINWFIEVVNGFSGQSDPEVKGKVITRLHNITELHKLLQTVLAVLPTFTPPLANFDLDDTVKPTAISSAAGSSKSDGKKKGGKPKKKKKADKDKTTSDSDENSRDSSALLDTTNNISQANTQDTSAVTKATSDQASVDLTNYKPYFRELDIGVLTILTTGLITRAALDTEMNTKAVTELSIQTPQLQFLLEDFCRKLNHALPASPAKQRTFLKSKVDKRIGFSNLDQYTALEIANKAVKLLPALCNHLEGTSSFFQTLIAENDGLIDGPGSHSPEALMMRSCFNLLLQAVQAIFSWNGFQMMENRGLLKDGLLVLAGRIKLSGHTQLSFTEIQRTAIQYVENFANTVPDMCTAVTLIKLLISLTENTDTAQVNKNLASIAEEFLKREWLSVDGERMKGAKFNEQLQTILRTFIIYSKDPLSSLEGITTKAIPELIEADKNGSSTTYPTMHRASFTVYYRVLFTELVETVRVIPPVKHKEARDDLVERLLRWNMAVRLLHILVDLIKYFDGRTNLITCIKYGRFFVDLFLRLGMPLLDQMFRSHRADIQGLLKNIQISTRVLQHICCHSKMMKDVTLTNQVPMMKRSLEEFVYRVKAMLNVNSCIEAFWVGNLKNRDLQGEEIVSQSSQVSVATRTTTGEDSDGDTVLDGDEDSDVELDGDNTVSSETDDVTDQESSMSQVC